MSDARRDDWKEKEYSFSIHIKEGNITKTISYESRGYFWELTWVEVMSFFREAFELMGYTYLPSAEEISQYIQQAMDDAREEEIEIFNSRVIPKKEKKSQKVQDTKKDEQSEEKDEDNEDTWTGVW